MQDLVVIQPGYKGLEQIAFLDDNKKIAEHYLPLHVGSVEYIRNVWKEYNIEQPEPNNHPIPLRKFMNRDIYYTHGAYKPKPGRFIKPHWQKAFDAFISTDNCPVIYSQFFDQEVVEFQQEYRVYILRGLIVGCGRYDDLDLPDVEQAELNAMACNIMAEWKDATVAYAIDLGVIKERGLSLVEITDAWSVGWFKPMDRKLYAEMLKARWDEIVGNK